MDDSESPGARSSRIGGSVLGALSRVVAVLPLVALILTVGLGYGWDWRRGQATGQGAVEKLRELGQVRDDLTRPGLRVYLTGRRVTDSTLDLLGELKDLRHLELSDTRVTDDGIRRLRHLTGLRSLYLDGVAITDEGLSSLVSLKDLECLVFMDTRITGTGLAGLETLERLDTLLVEGPLTTTEGLARLKGLKALWLIDTCITAGGLGFLKDLREIEELHLDEATLTSEDWEDLRRANPKVRISSPPPGHRDLEGRRLRRQGLTGRLRLAWRRHIFR